MKAIVNVKKSSSFSKFNFLTFEVKEVLSAIVCLNINGNSVDFSFGEVIIVNFQDELLNAWKEADLSTEKMVLLHRLRQYKMDKGITSTDAV